MKAGVYLRVSTEEQREKQSILTQREFAERYCALHDIPLIDYYADDGISGTIALEQRPGGRQLLSDAREGKIDTVLIYKLDRFGRDPRHILNAIHELETYGVQVKSMNEPFDTTSPAGKLMITMLSGFAGFERDTIVARSVEGTNRLAREGVWLGGICPYGYQVVGKDRDARLTPSEAPIPGLSMSEAYIVRFIYSALGDEGRSCFWVAEQLTALGVPSAYVRDGREANLPNKRKTTTSGIWRPGRIRNLVVNTTYKGVHQYGKRAVKSREIIEREVPALVSVDLWERAQETLRKNQLFSARNAKRQYLLRGLIKCGLCGLTYIGTGYPLVNGQEKYYYTCNGKHGARGIYGMKGERCPAKAVPGTIEDVVWGDIQGFLRDPGEVLRQLQSRFCDETGEAGRFRKEAVKVQQALSEKAKERDIVVGLYRKGRIDADTLDRQLDQVQKEEAVLKERATSLTLQAQAAEESGKQLRSAEDLLRELNRHLDEPLTWELKRQLVETLVETIRVDTVGEGSQISKEAVVTVKYCFGTTKDTAIVTCTGTGSWRQ